MSRIRAADTKPELTLRRLLHRKGLRYRLHVSELPGRPDLVFPRLGAVVFIHGCFWHHHGGCSIATLPKSNTDFWQAKFANNVARDRRAVAKLRRLGWRVRIVWECQLCHPARAQATAMAVATWLKGNPSR